MVDWLVVWFAGFGLPWLGLAWSWSGLVWLAGWLVSCRLVGTSSCVSFDVGSSFTLSRPCAGSHKGASKEGTEPQMKHKEPHLISFSSHVPRVGMGTRSTGRRRGQVKAGMRCVVSSPWLFS